MIAVLAAFALAQGVVTVEVCKGPVTALAFGPGGVLYAGGEDTFVRFGANHGIDKRFSDIAGKVTAVAVSPDGDWILVAGGRPHEAGFARAYRPGGQLHRRSPQGMISAIAFQTNPRSMWIGEPDSALQRVQLPNSDVFILERKLPGHSGPVHALACLPGGNVLSGGADGTLRLWGGEPTKLLRSLSFHTGPIHAIALPGIVQGPMWCATASEDKTIRIWQPEIGRMVRIIRGAEGPLLALAITPDGNRVISGGAEGIVRMQSVDGGDPTATWRVPGEWIHSIAISPDGKKLAFGASDGKVRIVGIGS